MSVAKLITDEEALKLFEEDPHREDVLILDKGMPVEEAMPVLLVEQLNTLLRVVYKDAKPGVDEAWLLPGQHDSTFYQLPEKMTWWDENYKSALQQLQL